MPLKEYLTFQQICPKIHMTCPSEKDIFTDPCNGKNPPDGEASKRQQATTSHKNHCFLLSIKEWKIHLEGFVYARRIVG